MTEVPDAKLAAVDATKYRELANTYSIKGFPTLKYFEWVKNNFDVLTWISQEKLSLISLFFSHCSFTSPNQNQSLWS